METCHSIKKNINGYAYAIGEFMSKNNFLIKIFNMFVLLIVSIFIGILLLWGVYTFPTDKMAKNVAKSENTIREQDDIGILIAGNYSEMFTSVDTVTHIIMFHEVITPSSGNAFTDALLVPAADYWADDWVGNLTDYATYREYEEKDYIPYARYWHGYLVFLKPLFSFFDLQTIYNINGILQLIIMIAIFFLFKKRLGNYCYAYLVTMLTMNPIFIMQSIQLSLIFYILHFVLLLLLLRKWDSEHIIYLFVLDGILVAYFDFLTYPLVALAIPLITYLLQNPNMDLKKKFFSVINNAISFVIGYIGMWGSKWIVATLFTNENIILDAINSVLYRTGIKDDEVSSMFGTSGITEALTRNMTVFFDEINCFILLVSIVVLAICILKNKKKPNIRVSNLLFYIIFAIMPFVWFAVLSNHCSYHPHLEWRTMSICVFSVSVILIEMFQGNLNENESIF